MSDILLRSEPIGSAPFVGAGVTISLAQPTARFSLRARNPRVLERQIGLTIPSQIGAIVGPVASLGPDEWLWRGAVGTTIAADADQPISIVDISERAVCLTLQGPRAAQVLMAGCPLDMERLAVGRATRTLFETVEIVVLHMADQVFEIEVWRSFAPWLWLALVQGACDLDERWP